MTLRSDDYADSAHLLAAKLWDMCQAKSMVPPLDIHITGADDDLVMHASMTEDGQLRDVSGCPEQPLTARFPLTATITDANGNTLEITIEPDMVVQ
jgi:hypothetical protein